jgi:oligopeptide/dipeptide ABC transporter ATP-binding protein
VGNLLEVRNLTTHFYTQDGVVLAVNDVSFDVEAGETVALVGESGCGKTVSALSVIRLIQEPPGKIISGEVLFQGVDILKISKNDMHKIRGAHISMIFQEPLTSLNPVLTIGLQLSEALEFHRNLSSSEAREESIRLLESVGIPQPERRIKEYPHNFSGGMRQRVMIAMAISCHPELIIADEPTTAVDVTVQAQLLELIKNISKRLNTSLVLITHNLGIVARYAQKVYVMYAGRIVEHGSVKDIFHAPAHPYTVGLLASVPRLDEPKKVRLMPISGQPPDLIFPDAGCAFKARCSCCEGDCHLKTHSLVEVSPGHFTACSLVQNGLVLWKKK